MRERERKRERERDERDKRRERKEKKEKKSKRERERERERERDGEKEREREREKEREKEGESEDNTTMINLVLHFMPTLCPHRLILQYAEDNISVMSIAFLLPNPNDAVIWRGPKKNSTICSISRIKLMFVYTAYFLLLL